MEWQAVFQDKVLQELIQEALQNNYDMRIAATRILEAQASLGITRSNQLPSLNGTFSIQNERSAQFPGAPTFDLAALQLKTLYRSGREIGKISRNIQVQLSTRFCSGPANVHYLVHSTVSTTFGEEAIGIALV